MNKTLLRPQLLHLAMRAMRKVPEVTIYIDHGPEDCLLQVADEWPFLVGVVTGGDVSCRAVLRWASRIAATSDGQPYISLIRAMARLSASSKRMVVAGRLCCLSFMPQYYHIDILPVKCDTFISTLRTE